jgi:hypothetical protein
MKSNSTSRAVCPPASFDARSVVQGACETHVSHSSATAPNRRQQRHQDQIDQRHSKANKARRPSDSQELGMTEFGSLLIKDLCEALPEAVSADERFYASLSEHSEPGQAVAPPSWFDPLASTWSWVASGVDSALNTLVWPRPVGAQSTCAVDGRCTNTVSLSQRRKVSDLVSEAKAAGWIVEMSPQMKERLARDPQCSLVDAVVMIPDHQHLMPQVNQGTMQLIHGFFVAGDESTGKPGDIVAVELEHQCETAPGVKLFGDACVSIDDAELRAVIEEQFFYPAVKSARKFLAEAERSNSKLKATFSAQREQWGDNDNLAVDMARDYGKKLAERLPKAVWPPAMADFLARYDALEAQLKKSNAAREKTMRRERKRLIQPGRTYYEAVGWLHAEAHRQEVFKKHPALYLSQPSAWANPATKQRRIDPV